MPTYQYYCSENHRSLEVIHGMSRTVETWGELCDLADADPGPTPDDTPVERLLGTGMVLAKKPEPGLSPPVGGCGCHGMCHGH